ncbi:hypothetical protein [Nocardia puris]|uniref:Uncharacterized protein n=1 Tax=Nocardia puris TaxID=208602 RepID=A0A366DDF4_9NOCA|nr:hypothetical protein [Nocardia puris]RBO87549.1 hypothetical protein DFR74_111256 [Nocardia puris]
MTAVRRDANSIEHLDHDPACESGDHDPDVPRADYWIDSHGCHQAFWCAACVENGREGFRRHESMMCRKCGRVFKRFAAGLKVVPLR